MIRIQSHTYIYNTTPKICIAIRFNTEIAENVLEILLVYEIN